MRDDDFTSSKINNELKIAPRYLFINDRENDFAKNEEQKGGYFAFTARNSSTKLIPPQGCIFAPTGILCYVILVKRK